MLASKHGKDKVIKVLLNSDANVKAVTNKQETALFFALSSGNEKSVNLLLDAGAIPHNRLVNGKAEMILAASSMSLDTVDRLLRSGGK